MALSKGENVFQTLEQVVGETVTSSDLFDTDRNQEVYLPIPTRQNKHLSKAGM